MCVCYLNICLELILFFECVCDTLIRPYMHVFGALVKLFHACMCVYVFACVCWSFCFQVSTRRSVCLLLRLFPLSCVCVLVCVL